MGDVREYEYDYDCVLVSARGDAGAAAALGEALSRYRLPDGKRLSCFLDKYEAPPDEVLLASLSRCRGMVVLCSPRAAASEAVTARLRVFAGVIIPVLCEGEPDESMPAFFTEEPVMPDLRGETKAARRQALAYETVRIAAALTGRRPDDLVLRHQRRRRARTITALLGAGAACLAVAACFLWLGFLAQNEEGIAARQAAAGADTIRRVTEELPAEAASIPGATAAVQDAMLASVDALVAHGSENAGAAGTALILAVSAEDSADVVFRKAALLRRLGETVAARAAYAEGAARADFGSGGEGELLAAADTLIEQDAQGYFAYTADDGQLAPLGDAATSYEDCRAIAPEGAFIL
ncbi:MAG: hypothetical protein LBR00_06410 [Clostridiales Family XIII bacterium]|nr:hypothetical protein [Clostridiales Family XIII bacterium]